ncbi:solute carrier family 26 member 6-like [Spea bombifrons]|uniref:solute carrier family 26 member 6-like n=1 Tax=Spea bombifrons TaxID=233779 RepID=UPI00234BF440|nr:solute carrier family 26 member 6-like [Spea bombifrons]
MEDLSLVSMGESCLEDDFKSPRRRTPLSEVQLEEIAPRCNATGPPLLSRIKKKIRCSGSTARSQLVKFIPILGWLPHYRVKEWLVGDIISGISVGTVQLPQGLAWGLLAGVPPVFGLYSSFYPVFIYSLFGTSKHLSIGTFAVMSVMVATVTESLAPNENFLLPGNDSVIDIVARDQARVEAASALSLLIGIFQIALGLMRFGFVSMYLSDPLIRGYTTAAAFHVTMSQLKSILGVEISQKSQPLSLIQAFVTLCAKTPQTNIGSLVTGIIAMIVLFTVKLLNENYHSKIRFIIPIELITLIVATGISYGVNLNEKFGMEVVGDIPVGIKAPVVPNISLFRHMIGNAFALAVVVYAFNISLAKMFAIKYGYNVDSNQELMAIGICHTVGSFFQCFSVATAMARCLVLESTGGNSQVSGFISSLMILVIILKAGELFETLPKTILGAIVIVNLKGIFMQFSDVPGLWRANKTDLLVWIVTFLATILLNMDMGLAVSVAFSLATVIARTQLPHYSILGQISNTEIYRDVELYGQVTEVPGVKIFQSSCTLYFANADLYADALKKMCGVDLDKLIKMKKKAIKKHRRIQEKAKKQRKSGAKGEIENELKAISPELAAATRAEDKSLINVSEETAPDYWGPHKCPFHSLILDLSTASFLDTVSVKVLRNIIRDFQEIDVKVYLVGCHASVVKQLELGQFFNNTIAKDQLFSSIHDAISYIFRNLDQSITIVNGGDVVDLS